jgi:hypothetical protein
VVVTGSSRSRTSAADGDRVGENEIFFVCAALVRFGFREVRLICGPLIFW